MSWNYRVIRSREPNGEFYYAIHECYYGVDRLPDEHTDQVKFPNIDHWAYASARAVLALLGKTEKFCG